MKILCTIVATCLFQGCLTAGTSGLLFEMKRKDHTGEKFSRMMVLEMEPRGRTTYAKCLCDCGNTKTVRMAHLVSKKIKSCGCWRSENSSAIHKTHGRSDSKIFRAWKRIKERCYNPNYIGFKNWGGRGIVMCDRWRNSFENFVQDVGEPPTPDHSIDRIDNNGNYEPSNVQWATHVQQGRNRRFCKINKEIADGMRKMFSDGFSRSKIIEMTGFTRRIVEQVISNKTWV